MNNNLHRDRNPSFSSTLLDEIYRSIDKCEAGQESGGRRQSHGGGGSGSIFVHQQHGSPINLRRAHSIGRRAAAVVRDGQQGHAYGTLGSLFSSGGGSSSNCCSHTTWGRLGDGFSSSETGKYTSSLANAPPLPRLRPIRTTVVSEAHPAARTSEKKITNSKRSQKEQDRESNSGNDRGDGRRFINPRSRALKSYGNPVQEKAKLQQPPLSPGGRLSAFLSSLFAARGRKKTNRSSSSSSSSSDSSLATGDATSSSNCSSASSYTRSCLSKTSPSSRQQLNGKKSVTFQPAADSVAASGSTGGTMKARECSPTLSETEGEEHGPIIPRKNWRESLKNYCHHHRYQTKSELMGFKFIDNVNYNDDAESCASSDLFELDHLDSIGDGRHCEGLVPVYETTRIDRSNRAAQFVIIK